MRCVFCFLKIHFMKNKLLLLICIFPLWLAAQQKITVSGYVYEKGSLESLPGILVYEPQSSNGVRTNNYGFYALTFPYTDSLYVVFSCMGFDNDTLRITECKDVSHNVYLSKGIMLDNVQITAERPNSEQLQMSSIKISPKEVKSIPIIFGEKDVFKTLLLMPGVQSGTEGTSGIYVRGGGPDQNLIILDEATIYNANHLLGFFSIFNGDAIKSVELIKGGFPARYGGRLSSVIDVQMKEGDKSAFHTEGGIGLISSHLMVEGPLAKNKSSFMISGRTTYFDLFAAPIMKILDEGFTAGYYFFDLNAKFNYDFGDKDKLYVSAYFGQDKFHLTENDDFGNVHDKYKMGLYWQNATATARWNHLFTNKIFSNLSFVFSDYKMNIYNKYISRDYKYNMEMNSGIRDYTLKYDFTFLPDAVNHIRAGAAVTYHESKPNAFMFTEDTVTLKNIQKERGLEYAFYCEDEINIRNKFRINPGVRLVFLSVPEKTYFTPEPRISASYNIRRDLALKASYTMMSQNMLLLSNSTIGLPTDLWVPVTKDVKPQISHQVALGLHYDLAKPSLSFSLEGYYKKMNHIIAYKEGASFFMDALEGIIDANAQQNWSSNLTSGQGWSYGMEFLVRKNVGKFTGWLGYTLSWTKQQFDDLNFGKPFFARYDRRHDVSIVLMYSPTAYINLSLAWVFASGNAVTLPTSIYESQDIQSFMDNTFQDHTSYYYSYIENYGDKNSFRMKPFHHLDVGVQFIKPHKKKGQSIFEISIYNVYNHKNPFFYFIDEEYEYNSYGVHSGKPIRTLKQISIFPIIPTFTYHFKF